MATGMLTIAAYPMIPIGDPSLASMPSQRPAATAARSSGRLRLFSIGSCSVGGCFYVYNH